MKYFLIFPILLILIGFSFASAQYQGDIKSYHLPVHVESESYSIVTQSIMTKFTKTLYDEPAKALIFSISGDEELIDTMAITMNNQTFLKLFPNVESEDPNDVFVLVNGEEIAYKAGTNLDIFSWVFMVPPKSTEIEIIGSPFYDSQQFFKPKLLINMNNFIQIYSPLKQDHLDISFDKIQCKQNLVLIQKYDGSPACVTESTKTKLVERGWTGENSFEETFGSAGNRHPAFLGYSIPEICTNEMIKFLKKNSNMFDNGIPYSSPLDGQVSNFNPDNIVQCENELLENRNKE